ncbi:double zinc ribbon domain-containing protein [Paracoccus xiamenensis]|uniref:double zinc ribbon domain-containing protein n=1 Tax=Paracoccus xiamenensis TaxID=2714901 RepID=UPI001408774A|nr:double zinc ribbon domain-containing protein [Paracoccus xiamenensis]NHF73693.1 ComF family protein [Paracoccus xiamenensis]
MKAALRLIYPPRCLACEGAVEQDGALCPKCWRDCEFVSGCACRRCGVPLPGDLAEDAGGDDGSLICDDCLATARPWRHGRAALVYRGIGRNLVLALKHGDRPDLAGPLGGWLALAVAPILREGMLVVPIPLHSGRLMQRKFNQVALLSAQVARVHGLTHCPSLLYRTRPTPAQDHRGIEERYANLRDALAVSPRYRAELRGRSVLLIDDVMASGATMSAAAEALLGAGAATVSIAVLARAVKE